MTVPLDWSAPQGTTTTVAVVRMRSSSQHERIGSMVFNPGGPGGAGVVDLTSNWTKFGLPLADRFDLVGFDPRGVGSSNQVSCITDADKVALVSLPAAIADALPVFNRIADGCSSANADPLVARVGTMAVVHDLDALRASLGDDKLTFFGYSYGSEIAAGYAATYPDRVRALVGDGAIDVYGTQADGARFSAAGTERGLQKAAALCAADAPCTALIADPLAVLDAELARAATSSPVVTGSRAVTPVTIGLASYVSVSQLSTLPVFFQALLDLRDRGDGTLMLGLADAFVGGDGSGHYDRTFDSYLSVTCADQADRPTAVELAALQTAMITDSPRSGQGLALFAAACTGWATPLESATSATPTLTTPMLVLGELADPQTPIELTTAFVARFGSSARLVEWDGFGHTSFPQTPCLADVVVDYLTDLTLPASSTCPTA